MSEAGLEPLLDDCGSVVRVESSATFMEYDQTIVPMLNSLTDLITDKSRITWSDGHISWMSAIRRGRVWTVAIDLTKEEHQ
jgi:hypothetical protein